MGKPTGNKYAKTPFDPDNFQIEDVTYTKKFKVGYTRDICEEFTNHTPPRPKYENVYNYLIFIVTYDAETDYPKEIEAEVEDDSAWEPEKDPLVVKLEKAILDRLRRKYDQEMAHSEDTKRLLEKNQ